MAEEGIIANAWQPGDPEPVPVDAPELHIDLLEDADPTKCLLVLNQAALYALTTAPSEQAHQDLLGAHVMQHLKDHHRYASTDRENPPINLRHEVR